jgi:hypothetical protein
VRSGVYRFVWEGQDAKGVWHKITEVRYEVTRPKLVVTIMEDSRFENWKYVALIRQL